MVLAKLDHDIWIAANSPSANAAICHHSVLRSFVSDSYTGPLFRVLLAGFELYEWWEIIRNDWNYFSLKV